MQSFLDFVIGTVAALFPVVDPVGSVPLFLVLTAGASPMARRRDARRIALNVTLLLVVSLLIGGSVLRFFGVSLAVVRIAGGIVVFHAAWRTMNSEPKLSDLENQDAVSRADHHGDITFMPMTIPLLAGPGAIAVALGLAAQAGRDISVETAVNLLAVAVGIGSIGIAVFLCLRSSMLLLKWLGAGGIHALSRLLGLFVMAIGVQLILNGLADWLESISISF
ncbi:antibiotic resistance protein MarC [filamentous cyanobacterium CCP5]|nr:antibiotic resistance protein MarC [filamentous cyanobacterium CCP5]